MKIDMYTDGACSGNPGVGGAAAIIKITHSDYHTEDTYSLGYEKNSTNQRMEIYAVLLGLMRVSNFIYLQNPEYREKISKIPKIELNIYSDSAYVVNCMNNKWYENWQKNGWKNAKKQSVANRKLWEELLCYYTDLIKDGIEINFIKVKGHSDNELNNEVDRKAVKARTELLGLEMLDCFKED